MTMNNTTATLAINAALSLDWKQALEMNTQIVDESPEDTDALNRLAYACLMLGKLADAKKYYNKVLKLDSYNAVAKKNLLKLANIKKPSKSSKREMPFNAINPSLFLEEPGKTKTVTLRHVAPFSVISALTIGEQVFLHPKSHAVDVRSSEKQYVGQMPDDVSFRLNRTLKGGNTYEVCIKNVSKSSLSVFIRETSRGKKFQNQPSFIPQMADYQASVHKEVDPEAEEKQADTE